MIPHFSESGSRLWLFKTKWLFDRLACLELIIRYLTVYLCV